MWIGSAHFRLLSLARKTSMTQLQPFLRQIAKRSRGALWSGETPSSRQSQIPAEVASKLGYPTSGFPIGDILQEVPLEEAASVMAYIARGSLAYPTHESGSAGTVKNAMDALREMKSDARFFTNGDWGNPRFENSKGWTPLSTATFDAGVLGIDSETAFIVWTEDED